MTRAMLLFVACGCGADLVTGEHSENLAVYGCQPGAIGTIGARFRGVPAYCQPSSATAFYQCDELANRFLRDALAHPALDNVVTEFASSMCGHAAARPEYSVWGPGFRNPAGHKPGAGDLIVWSGTPGHVAVVTGSSGNTIQYVQQNLNAPTGSIGWNARRSFFDSPTAKCWVHAEPSLPEPPSGPDCGCFDGEGDYCGLAVIDHQGWAGCFARSAEPLDPGVIYSCRAGVFETRAQCTSCVTNWMSPAFGHCADGDPCGQVSPTRNGTYCGRSTQNGFSGGDPDTLYHCHDGVVASTTACSGPCVVAPPGQSDSCP